VQEVVDGTSTSSVGEDEYLKWMKKCGS